MYHREKENLESAHTQEEKEVIHIREQHKRLLQEGEARAKEAQTLIDQIQQKYSQLLTGVSACYCSLGFLLNTQCTESDVAF